jgi:hypothetical protein
MPQSFSSPPESQECFTAGWSFYIAISSSSTLGSAGKENNERVERLEFEAQSV